MPNKLMVGWREWIALPDLHLPAIKAKIDTGAKTSALHAFKVEPFTRDGDEMVRFWLRPLRKHPEIVRVCEAPVHDSRIVSDSGGHRERRFIIKSMLEIADMQWPIEISLTDRDSMLFRFLLGRTAMQDRLLVDPAASYTLGRKSTKIYRS